jgi:saccharopine dehydrogenase-like NADP-dependent oxidoreductase
LQAELTKSITGDVGPEKMASVLGWHKDDPRIIPLLQRVSVSMEQLGMKSKELEVDHNVSTNLDAFCSLLEDKLAYAPGERDMVCLSDLRSPCITNLILNGEICIRYSYLTQEFKTSTMIAYGDPKSYSAMAKTVGFPAAIAVRLLLDGVITKKGVIAPMDKAVYEPILYALESEGIKFTESSMKLP